MKHLIAIPIILIFTIIYLTSKTCDCKFLKDLSKVVIIVAIIYFIITYAMYLGFNWKSLLQFHFHFKKK